MLMCPLVVLFLTLSTRASAAGPGPSCPKGACPVASLPSSFTPQRCFFQFPVPVPDDSAPEQDFNVTCPSTSECAPEFLTAGATEDGSPFTDETLREPFDFYVCFDGMWGKGRLFLLKWLQANSNVSPRFANYSDKVIANCILGGDPSCKGNEKRCQQQCDQFSRKLCEDCKEEAARLGFPICDFISTYVRSCS